MTVPTPNNRLGKTALWVHLGGLVLGAIWLGLAFYIHKPYDVPYGDDFIVGGMGLAIYFVTTAWALVLCIRGIRRNESTQKLWVLLGLLLLECAALIIVLQCIALPTRIVTEAAFLLVPGEYVRKLALPVFVSTFALAVYFTAWMRWRFTRKPEAMNPQPTPTSVKRELKWLAVFLLSYAVLTPLPLAWYCIHYQSQDWQGDFSEKVLLTSPTVFNLIGNHDAFITQRIKHHAWHDDANDTPVQLVNYVAKLDNLTLRRAAIDSASWMRIPEESVLPVYWKYAQDSDPLIQDDCLRYLYMHSYALDAHREQPSEEVLKLIHNIYLLLENKNPAKQRFATYILASFINHKTFNIRKAHMSNPSPIEPELQEIINTLKPETEAWLKAHTPH